MNNQKSFPIVEFEYPDSETKVLKTRFVRVLTCDADRLTGYEIESQLSKKPGQFKMFNRNRITKNGISLLYFQ